MKEGNWSCKRVPPPFPSCSLNPRDFNSYGSRRGNDAVMARGTFANIRLFNKFLNKQAPRTLHLPSGETVTLLRQRCCFSPLWWLSASQCCDASVLS